MANFTPNVNLEKPLGSEHYLVPKFNANMDKIDTKFGELQNLGGIISGATAKTTPVDADTVALSDSTATGALKKLSWLNIKDTLKTYFDTLYQSVLVSGTNIKTINGNSVLGSGDLPITSGVLKNWIINGMFDVWQRGTTQTTSGYGSDDRFTNLHNGSSKTHSRQAFTIGQTDVPNNPTYFSRTVVASGNTSTSFTFKQTRIEDVTKLAGKTITISFWAKADANKNLSIELAQQFGDGGSSDVVGIGVQKFALTTSWQRFTKTVTLPSVSGKTVGLNNRIEFNIWFDAGANFDARTNSLGNQSGTFDIANISLVEGSVAIECQNQPYADVLRECMRYYQRFGGNSVYEYLAQGIVSHTTIGRFLIPLNGKMRSLPQLEYAMLLIVQPASSNLAVLSAGIDMAGTDTCSINATCAGGLTLSQPVYLTTNNSLSGYIAFSAEL